MIAKTLGRRVVLGSAGAVLAAPRLARAQTTIRLAAEEFPQKSDAAKRIVKMRILGPGM